MLYIILVVLGAWAVLATVASVSVCVSAARFNHEADQTAATNPPVERVPPEAQSGLTPQRLR